MPYICLKRTDIPAGTLQVLDLKPNESQRNSPYETFGQTKYVDRLQNDTVAVSSSLTSAEYKGLAAYLIDVIARGTDGHALSATQANAMAASIVTNILNAGAAATLVAVNVRLAAVNAGTALTAGGSIGAIADVLKILAGGEYVLPVGRAANSGAAFVATATGAFTDGQYRPTYDSGAFNISVGSGQLSVFKSSTFTYNDTTGAAVVVYDDTGAVL